ncbi:MAG: acyltransferase family protein [Solirubrobacterales bacterium]
MSPEPRPVVASHARFPLVDGVRAIAALTIFFFHVAFHLGLLTQDALSRYLGNLNVGVPIFFVVSGFLLYRPFVAARLDRLNRPATGPYAARRVMRIVPAYWVALPIVTVMLGIESEVFTPSGIVTYFGFLQIYDISTVVGGIGQAWTLCIEVTFYIALVFWAIGARRLPARSRGELVRWELIVLAGLFAFSLFWQLVVAPSFTPGERGYMPAQISLPAFADQFALGMALAVISAAASAGMKLPQPFAALERRPWVWVLLALGLYALLGLRIGPVGLGESWSDAGPFRHVVKGLIGVCVLAPAVFGAALGGYTRKALGWRPLLLLGLVSYSFYLYHLAFIIILDRVGWLHDLGWVAVAAASFACSVAAAAVSYRLIEAPGIALGRRWAARLSARRPAKAAGSAS